MSIFFIFVALIEIWLQNQIKHIVSGIIPTFFVWIRHIWENKNITSSGCSHGFSVNFRFFGHFRLPEVIKTPTKPQFQPFSMPSKKVWANISSRVTVIERLNFDHWKKKLVILFLVWYENFDFLITKLTICKSASASIRIAADFPWPCLAARCSGVSPFLSSALISLFRSTKASTDEFWPLRAATWRAERPCSSFVSTSKSCNS